MPEIRKDPLLGRFVIIAPGRDQRPQDFLPTGQRREGGECPFCEGREHVTPHEILAYRKSSTAPDSPGWRLRVVPNKFPALEKDATAVESGEGLYRQLGGFGAHEVIIESPRHVRSLTELSSAAAVDVFRAYRDRLADLKCDRRLVYGLLFKNVGAAAGASLEHVHSQLIATPIVPLTVAEELQAAADYERGHGRCAFCAMIDEELRDGRRVVLDTPEFVAFCPFASRFAYETWLVPKRHASHFELLPDDLLPKLARAMTGLLGRIEAVCDPPAYNYALHTAPFDTPPLRHYHWHIEVMPSLTKTAGYEWGSGFFINPLPPEEAAKELSGFRLRGSG